MCPNPNSKSSQTITKLGCKLYKMQIYLEVDSPHVIIPILGEWEKHDAQVLIRM